MYLHKFFAYSEPSGLDQASVEAKLFIFVVSRQILFFLKIKLKYAYLIMFNSVNVVCFGF